MLLLSLVDGNNLLQRNIILDAVGAGPEPHHYGLGPECSASVVKKGMALSLSCCSRPCLTLALVAAEVTLARLGRL
jgi:hypothetical protein